MITTNNINYGYDKDPLIDKLMFSIFGKSFNELPNETKTTLSSYNKEESKITMKKRIYLTKNGDVATIPNNATLKKYYEFSDNNKVFKVACDRVKEVEFPNAEKVKIYLSKDGNKVLRLPEKFSICEQYEFAITVNGVDKNVYVDKDATRVVEL